MDKDNNKEKMDIIDKKLYISIVSDNEVIVCPKCGQNEIYSFHSSNVCLNNDCDWAN